MLECLLNNSIACSILSVFMRCRTFLICLVHISNNRNYSICKLTFYCFHNPASFIIQKLCVSVPYQINFIYKFRAFKQSFNHDCKQSLLQNCQRNQWLCQKYFFYGKSRELSCIICVTA